MTGEEQKPKRASGVTFHVDRPPPLLTRASSETALAVPATPVLRQQKSYRKASLVPPVRKFSADTTALQHSRRYEKLFKGVDEDKRSLKVFLSSTFNDMQMERTCLVEQAFPELRRLCMERGILFVEVDLRTGVSAEKGEKLQTIHHCLKEVDNSDYLITMLGQRYGWSQSFAGEDPKLQGCFDMAAREYPWIMDYVDRSITELEIRHGLYQHPNISMSMTRNRFFFRNDSYLNSVSPEDLWMYTSNSEEAKQKLENLKAEIDSKFGQAVLRYHDPAQVAEATRQWLCSEIHQRYPVAPMDPFEREWEAHRVYGMTRLAAYVPNQEYIEAINDFAKQKNERALFISGSSGSGKSSLVAAWAEQWQKEAHGFTGLTLVHYIGGSPHSAKLSNLLARVLTAIKYFYDFHHEVPSDLESLKTSFGGWLISAGEKQGIILVLDAIDQLEADSSLDWIPRAVFAQAGVRFIVTSKDNSLFNSLRGITDFEKLEVQPITKEQREVMVKKYLGTFGKELSKTNTDKILDSRSCENPLYLRTVLEEIRLFGHFEWMDHHITKCLTAQSLDDLFMVILARMEKNFNQDVEGTLTALWAARKGLSEDELMAVLDLSKREWTPLAQALRDSFISRGTQLGFFHNSLRIAVEKRYLYDSLKVQNVHICLAKYFSRCQLTERTIDELPWQLECCNNTQTLAACVLHLPTFHRMRSSAHNRLDLARIWKSLNRHFASPETKQQLHHLLETPMRKYHAYTNAFRVLKMDFSANPKTPHTQHFLVMDVLEAMESVVDFLLEIDVSEDEAWRASLYTVAQEIQSRIKEEYHRHYYDHPKISTSERQLQTILARSGKLVPGDGHDYSQLSQSRSRSLSTIIPEAEDPAETTQELVNFCRHNLNDVRGLVGSADDFFVELSTMVAMLSDSGYIEFALVLSRSLIGVYESTKELDYSVLGLVEHSNLVGLVEGKAEQQSFLERVFTKDAQHPRVLEVYGNYLSTTEEFENEFIVQKVYHKAKSRDEGCDKYEAALEMMTDELEKVDLLCALGSCYRSRGCYGLAHSRFLTALGYLEQYSDFSGEYQRRMFRVMAGLVNTSLDLGRFTEASQYLQKCKISCDVILDPKVPSSTDYLKTIADLYLATECADEACNSLQTALDILKTQDNTAENYQQRMAAVHFAFARMCDKCNFADKAEHHMQEAIAHTHRYPPHMFATATKDREKFLWQQRVFLFPKVFLVFLSLLFTFFWPIASLTRLGSPFTVLATKKLSLTYCLLFCASVLAVINIVGWTLYFITLKWRDHYLSVLKDQEQLTRVHWILYYHRRPYVYLLTLSVLVFGGCAMGLRFAQFVAAREHLDMLVSVLYGLGLPVVVFLLGMLVRFATYNTDFYRKQFYIFAVFLFPTIDLFKNAMHWVTLRPEHWLPLWSLSALVLLPIIFVRPLHVHDGIIVMQSP